jgi:hypothetical protein
LTFITGFGRKPDMSTGCTLVNCRELLDGATGCPSGSAKDNLQPSPFSFFFSSSFLFSLFANNNGKKERKEKKKRRKKKGRFRDYNQVGESLRNSPTPPVMVLPCY